MNTCLHCERECDNLFCSEDCEEDYYESDEEGAWEEDLDIVY